MTFYQQQVLSLKSAVFPDDELCRQVIAAKEYIDRHFMESIDLKTVAGKAFYSKFHFLRLFKSMYGTTPHRYLTMVRIRKAKELLLHHGISATEVCQAVGFDSMNSFRKLFKSYTGFTPASFQSRYQFPASVTCCKKAILKWGKPINFKSFTANRPIQHI